MTDLFRSPNFCKLLFGGLSPRDASEFLAASRTAHDTAIEFRAAIIFLFSRPCYSVDGMSMQVLQKVWMACAQSLVACGLDPGMWLHAEHVECLDEIDGSYKNAYWESRSGAAYLTDLIRLALDPEEPDVTCAQDHLCHMSGEFVVANILAILSIVIPHDIVTVHALVSDFAGRFALVDASCLELLDMHGGPPTFKLKGIAYLHNDLSSLMKLVEETHGERVRWLLVTDEDDDGRKYLSLSTADDDGRMTRNPPFASAIRKKYILPEVYYYSIENKPARDAFNDQCELRLSSAWLGCQERTFVAKETRESPIKEPEPPIFMERFIQPIEHLEPPAIRDPSMLHTQADSQWADDVAHLVHSGIGAMQGEEVSEQAPVDVLVLRFGSPAGGGDGLQRFRTNLMEGPRMSPCRAALADAGFSYELPGGALMFVKPEDAAAVLLAVEGHNLCHYHIVIDACLEYVLDEMLTDFTFQKRPKKKCGASGRIRVCADARDDKIESSVADDMDDQIELESMVLIEERTFLSWKPKLKPSYTVTQSTTEAAGSQSEMYNGSSKGVNPRRVA